jgi:uncharacterized protein YbaP (TraB family)
MKKQLKVWMAAAMLLLAVGCGSLGLRPAKGLDQQLAYAEGQVTAVRLSAAQALTAGTLAPEKAQEVLTATDTARSAIDAARTSEALGDTSGAAGKLQVVTATLLTLQQFLAMKAALPQGSK